VLPPSGDAQDARNHLGPRGTHQSGAMMQNRAQTPLITQTGTLTDEQKVILQDAYSEELLAHDVYAYMVTKYPALTEVNNIINSEAQHQSSVGNLLDAYGLTRPTDYRIYTDTNDTLRKMVDSSLTGAIEAGIMIETGDIEHLLTEYRKIENLDIRQVFENIGGGSFNHLRAFLRMAQSSGYTPKTDTNKYLTAADLNTRGPLHSKMTELLQANGLPTYSSGMMMGHGGNGGRHGMGGDRRPRHGSW
jgi:hypothetical protein